MAKKIVVYTIPCFEFGENEHKKDFFKGSKLYEGIDLEKVKAHPGVNEQSLEDFTHDFNTEQVDIYGVIAYEEVEVAIPFAEKPTYL